MDVEDRPDITQIVEDVSFYDDEDSEIIIEGVASMHISMVPNVGDRVLITATLLENGKFVESKQMDEGLSASLPFAGVVTQVKKHYWLSETERQKHPFEWDLHIDVYVKRTP